MPPLSFEERATSGCYDQLAVTFDQKPDSLATVDYGTHFTTDFAAWRDGDVKNHRTTFVPIDKSLEEGASEELVVNIIGEVAREGNELTARGNTWLKRNQKILEKNSAKDVLVLALPTMATPALTILYENQICTLEALEDSVTLPTPKVRVTSFTYLSLLTLPSGRHQNHPLRSINGFRGVNHRRYLSVQISGMPPKSSLCGHVVHPRD